MSGFIYEDDETEESLEFNPVNGVFNVESDKGWVVMTIPKREAINLASKLLQWGTSS